MKSGIVLQLRFLFNLMSTKTITNIAVSSLGFVFLLQAFIIADYFSTVKQSLTRETEAILSESFRKELNYRNEAFKVILTENEAANANRESVNGTIVMDFNLQAERKSDDLLKNFDLVLNQIISELIPINLTTLDSITSSILQSRNIYSSYQLRIIHPTTNEVLQSTKALEQSALFEVASQPFPLDFENKQALQLILINPFALIIQRMGIMLLASVVFSIICLLAFRYLLKIVAQQKQLVRFKNDFLSNIAHELKRPVASLLVNFEMLQIPEVIQNEKTRELTVNNSLNSLHEMNGTISMIVGLAREEEGLLRLNKKPINVVATVEELTSRFIGSRTKLITIETHYTASNITVMADELMLSQCFANIMDNAIKYSNNEVMIHISIRSLPNSVEFSFRDNGIGIPAEKLPTIFEKYSRVDPLTKVSGFGIGLNYVKTIVEKHGGAITVESEPGVGSDFKIVLPTKK